MTMVAVTGASGFIGKHVRIELASRGFDVRALVRAKDSIGITSAPGQVVAVDYSNQTGIREALNGSHAVVHLLGQAHDAKATSELYEQVNVAYTRLVMRASVDRGVCRVVFMSSVKALGNGRDVPYTDASIPCPEDCYGVSKLRAEDIVRELAIEAGIDYAILRPTIVYGAGVRGNLRRLIGSIERGYPIPVPRPSHAQRSLISAHNLASAVAAVLESRRPTGGTYLVADGNDITFSELVHTIGRVSGKGVRALPIPPGIFERMKAVRPLRSQIDSLLRSLRVDAGAFADRFTWEADQSLDDGIRQAIEGYRFG